MIEWKQIDGYNYEISNTGLVRNLTSNRILKNGIHDKRYYRVNLAKNGVNKSFLLHRWVAEYFCEKQIGDSVVHHKDNNGFNNHFENLMWTTQSYNIQIAFKEGNAKNDFKITRRGKGNPNYKHGLYCKYKYLNKEKRRRKRVW